VDALGMWQLIQGYVESFEDNVEQGIFRGDLVDVKVKGDSGSLLTHIVSNESHRRVTIIFSFKDRRASRDKKREAHRIADGVERLSGQSGFDCTVSGI
jgi:hypothetical protein